MQRLVEDDLSNEDYLLIQASQLGTPLAAYRLRRSYIRFLYRSGLFLFTIGIVILIVVLVISFIRRFQFDTLLPTLLAGLSGLLGGWICLQIVFPKEQSTHAIVCEHGLLQVQKKFRSNRIEIVRWKDIPTIGNTFAGRDFHILYGNGERLTLSSAYQDIDELVGLIKQRSGGI